MKKTILLAFLALCSCEATQTDREKNLPVALQTEQRTVPLSYGGTFDPDLVRQAKASLGYKTELSADVEGVTPEQFEQILPQLVTLGLDPDRVHLAPLTIRYRAVQPRLILSRTQVALPACSKVIRSGWLGDVTPSIENVGRCVQNNNLAQMLADPSDLYRTPAFHASPAERAAFGVRRLNEGRDPALPTDKLGTGLNGNGGTEGMMGGSVTDGQTQTQSSGL